MLFSFSLSLLLVLLLLLLIWSNEPTPETAFLDAFFKFLPIGFASASKATNAHRLDALGMSPLASAIKRSVYSTNRFAHPKMQSVREESQYSYANGIQERKNFNSLSSRRWSMFGIVVPSPSVCELHPVVNAKYKKSPNDSMASSLSFQNCGPNTSRTESETDSETSCRRRRRRRTGRRKGEREREGENRWRSVFVKRTETKRARVPNNNDSRGFHFPISKEEEKKRVVPFDSNRPFDARELSLVAPRVASVGLASAPRPHRRRCDSRSCLRVRALFNMGFGVG